MKKFTAKWGPSMKFGTTMIAVTKPNGMAFFKTYIKHLLTKLATTIKK